MKPSMTGFNFFILGLLWKRMEQRLRKELQNDKEKVIMFLYKTKLFPRFGKAPKNNWQGRS
jgi:hypothetical protein